MGPADATPIRNDGRPAGGHPHTTGGIPKDIDRASLRLGMPGSATVFAPDAGVIGILMSILVWISSYTAYL